MALPLHKESILGAMALTMEGNNEFAMSGSPAMGGLLSCENDGIYTTTSDWEAQSDAHNSTDGAWKRKNMVPLATTMMLIQGV